jgi:hypothetical protein
MMECSWSSSSAVFLSLFGYLHREIASGVLGVFWKRNRISRNGVHNNAGSAFTAQCVYVGMGMT